MTPDWREIEEFPDYAVNQYGEIANMRSGLPRKPSINQHGILKISLYKNRRELFTRSVAVIVADAFVEGKSEHWNTPIHLDGNHQNCRADNLMWRPRWFAVKFHKQFYKTNFYDLKLHIVELNTGREFYSVDEACTTFGLHYEDVYHSYVEEMPVPLTRHEFRIYGEH